MQPRTAQGVRLRVQGCGAGLLGQFIGSGFRAAAQGLLGQFIDFIQERKTVALDDVAAEFGLRTQDVINRIQGLEAMGRLTGVMDDRGKVRGSRVRVRVRTLTLEP